MPKTHELDSMFYPKSVAVVGASANPTGWGGGTSFVSRLQERGFAGKIYPINPRAAEILGLKVFPKVSSVPEPVDLVIVGVTAPRVPQVL